MNSQINPILRLWPSDAHKINQNVFNSALNDLSEIFSKSLIKDPQIESSIKHGLIRQLDLVKYLVYFEKSDFHEEAFKLCKCLYKMNYALKGHINCLDDEQLLVLSNILSRFDLSRLAKEFPNEEDLLECICRQKLMRENSNKQEIFQFSKQLPPNTRFKLYTFCANNDEASRTFLITFLNQLPIDAYTRSDLILQLSSAIKTKEEFELLKKSIQWTKVPKENRLKIFENLFANLHIQLDFISELKALPMQDFSPEEILSFIKAITGHFHLRMSFPDHNQQSLINFYEAICKLPLDKLSLEQSQSLIKKITAIEPGLKLWIVKDLLDLSSNSFFSYFSSKHDPFHLNSLPKEGLLELVIELAKSDLPTIHFLLREMGLHSLFQKLSKDDFLKFLKLFASKIVLDKDSLGFDLFQKTLDHLPFKKEELVEMRTELFSTFIEYSSFGILMMRTIGKTDPEFIKELFVHKNLDSSDLSELADIFSKWDLNRLFKPNLFNKFDADHQKIFAKLLGLQGELTTHIDNFNKIQEDTWIDIVNMLLERRALGPSFFECVKKIADEKDRWKLLKKSLDIDFKATLLRIEDFGLFDDKKRVKLFFFCCKNKEMNSCHFEKFNLAKENWIEIFIKCLETSPYQVIEEVENFLPFLSPLIKEDVFKILDVFLKNTQIEYEISKKGLDPSLSFKFLKKLHSHYNLPEFDLLDYIN